MCVRQGRRRKEQVVVVREEEGRGTSAGLIYELHRGGVDGRIAKKAEGTGVN